jgi:hypothetical protein
VIILSAKKKKKEEEEEEEEEEGRGRGCEVERDIRSPACGEKDLASTN